MKNALNLLLLALTVFATSCATQHSRAPGSELSSVKGVAALTVVLLTDKPGAALVEKWGRVVRDTGATVN